jgi:hypothetical protein
MMSVTGVSMIVSNPAQVRRREDAQGNAFRTGPCSVGAIAMRVAPNTGQIPVYFHDPLPDHL